MYAMLNRKFFTFWYSYSQGMPQMSVLCRFVQSFCMSACSQVPKWAESWWRRSFGALLGSAHKLPFFHLWANLWSKTESRGGVHLHVLGQERDERVVLDLVDSPIRQSCLKGWCSQGWSVPPGNKLQDKRIWPQVEHLDWILGKACSTKGLCSHGTGCPW